MKIKITAQPNIAEALGNVTFEVWAEGRDENGNDVVATPTNTSKLEITGAATATIASASASTSIILDGANSEILSFTTTVKDGTYDLTWVKVTLDSAVAALDWQSMTLEVDGSSVGSKTYTGQDYIIIDNLNEPLAAWKHTFTVKANANVDNAGSATVSVKKVSLNWDEANGKTMSVKKLIVKAYPVISATTSSPTLTLKISNPVDNNEDFEIVGFEVDGNITYASFDGTTISDVTAMNTEIAAKELSLSDGDEVELVIDAAKNTTVKVTGIAIKIDGKVIVINSDYTTVGKWSNFRVSGGDNGSTNSGAVASFLTIAWADEVDVGDTIQLTAKIDNATVAASWKSSDTTKATVSGTWLVEWVAGGTAKITATVNGSSISKTITVNVP